MLEESIRRWNPWWADREVVEAWVGIPRTVLPDILKTATLRHMKDLIGVRRSGKTTVMYQVIRWLLQDVPSKNIVFLNFDDADIAAASFSDIEKTLAMIYPGMRYLFLDEVQQKKGWEQWVRTLYDTRAFAQIVVSGSSASLLSQDIGRVLTGRHLTFSIFPFSFREFLLFRGWKEFAPGSLRYHTRRLLHEQREYLKGGGFPEAVGRTNEEQKIILTNIYTDILSRDISARFGAAYETAKTVSYHLLSNNTHEFSYRSVAKATGLSVETTEKYIAFLKESFLLLTMNFFSYKTKVQFRQNKKAYSIDTGLRNAVSWKVSEDWGKLAENVVFLELKRRGKDVLYWKDKKGKEVDFVVREGLRVSELIQVCWDVSREDTKKREVTGLQAAAETLGMKQATVVTEDHSAQEKKGSLTIRYLPLWQWLLE